MVISWPTRAKGTQGQSTPASVALKAQPRSQHGEEGTEISALKQEPGCKRISLAGHPDPPQPCSETLAPALEPTGLSVTLRRNSLCRHKGLLSPASGTAPDSSSFHQRPVSPGNAHVCPLVTKPSQPFQELGGPHRTLLLYKRQNMIPKKAYTGLGMKKVREVNPQR